MRRPSAGEAEMRAEQVDDEGDADTTPQEIELGDDELADGDDTAESALSAPARRNWDLSPETDYKPFTTRFDEMVEATRSLRRR